MRTVEYYQDIVEKLIYIINIICSMKYTSREDIQHLWRKEIVHREIEREMTDKRFGNFVYGIARKGTIYNIKIRTIKEHIRISIDDDNIHSFVSHIRKHPFNEFVMINNRGKTTISFNREMVMMIKREYELKRNNEIISDISVIFYLRDCLENWLKMIQSISDDYDQMIRY